MRTSPITSYRRTSRHQLVARGQAVATRVGGRDAFHLIGERFLDASAEGVLLACDDRIALGDRVIVSFPIARSGLVFDAETEVVRVLAGHREGDPGYCAGLRFTYFDRRDRLALGVDLRGLPLAPQRIRWGHAGPSSKSRPAGSIPSRIVSPTVVVSSIVHVG